VANKTTSDQLQHMLFTATHCNSLQHTATHCNNGNTLQQWEHAATMGRATVTRCGKEHDKRSTATHASHCNILQLIAAYCNTLQQWGTFANGTRQAINCNTCKSLQHTATHCNILQHNATMGRICQRDTPIDRSIAFCFSRNVCVCGCIRVGSPRKAGSIDSHDSLANLLFCFSAFLHFCVSAFLLFAATPHMHTHTHTNTHTHVQMIQHPMQGVAVCCRMLQGVAECCSVL